MREFVTVNTKVELVCDKCGQNLSAYWWLAKHDPPRVLKVEPHVCKKAKS